MLLPALHAQPSRTDSLTSLLMASADLKEKAVLLLQRSKAWPSTQTDKPLADAQQALALYQQTKNQEGQVDAYLQISAVYARQNQYKLALTVDSSTLELASNIHYTKGRAQALSQMARNQYSMGSLRDAEKIASRHYGCLQKQGWRAKQPIHTTGWVSFIAAWQIFPAH